MQVDIYEPTEFDDLSVEELDLYHLIMEYRDEMGLSPIPLSAALTATAGRHVADTYYNMMLEGQEYGELPDGSSGWPSGGNLHSWSDAPYFADHSEPEVMWDAPERLGLDYPSAGYEISAAGYGSGAAALEGWKGSPDHNNVIINQDIWQDISWEAIGVGQLLNPEDQPGLTFQGNIFHVWFGADPDPEGPPVIAGTDGPDMITGTEFSDIIHPGGGNDTITMNGGENNQVLLAGGDNTVWAGQGNIGDSRVEIQGHGDNTVGGGAGDDTLIVQGDGNNVLYGGADDDLIRINGDGNNTAWAGTGEDVIEINGHGNNTVGGGPDDAMITISGHGDNTVYGGGGQGANDILVTGDGDNLIFGGNSVGTDGNTITIYGDGDNLIRNGPGDDTVIMSNEGQGDSTLMGSPGDDEFIFRPGTSGTVEFMPGDGHDTITGFDLSSDQYVDLSAFYTHPSQVDADIFSFPDEDGNAVIFIGGDEDQTLTIDIDPDVLANADTDDWLIV